MILIMGTHFQGTEQEISALDAYIKLSRAAEAVTTRINRHLKAENLTISQFGVLEAIHHLGPMHQHRLGQKILKSGGNMTLVIDNLQKRGLVEREQDPADRRCITVRLTDRTTGAEFYHDFAPGVGEIRMESESSYYELTELEVRPSG